jgi:hypothetical protein
MDVVAAVDGQKIHDRQETLSEGRSGKGDGVAQVNGRQELVVVLVGRWPCLTVVKRCLSAVTAASATIGHHRKCGDSLILDITLELFRVLAKETFKDKIQTREESVSSGLSRDPAPLRAHCPLRS